MTPKNAAFFAFIGMVLLTALLLVRFVRDVSNVMGGLTPAMNIAASFIELFASLGVTVFFWMFYSKQ